MTLFPPALVPILRDRWIATTPELPELRDELLVELLTSVYLAGLETYEGEHGTIRVVFVADSHVDVVMPERAADGGPAVYYWKVMRFEVARPFAIGEIVKLSVATANEHLYAAVMLDRERLAIAGLAREGLNRDDDPFLKVISARPGQLSIRRGSERLLDYGRGAIVNGGEDVVMTRGPVRDALEAAARAAGMDGDEIVDYLHSVHALVAAMSAHGRGGILVISPEIEPPIARSTPYRMAIDASISTTLRLSRRVRRGDDTSSYGFLLHRAFLTEIERMIEEYAALTAIDGATVLNCGLALHAFGVVLPVGHRSLVDLRGRGTRHRASATYASEHPGSVVFVSSEDGGVSCMLRRSPADHLAFWQLRSA